MPLRIARDRPSLLIRRSSFERSALTRADVDERLNLTSDEFQVEGDLICIGPVYDDDAFAELIHALEQRGLQAHDDFYDLSGGWPPWLDLFAMAARR